jgi:hypothetical protein
MLIRSDVGARLQPGHATLLFFLSELCVSASSALNLFSSSFPLLLPPGAAPLVFKGAGLDSTSTHLYTIQNCHPDRSGRAVATTSNILVSRFSSVPFVSSVVKSPPYSRAPANLFALSRRNLAKNPFARAISFPICAFNSSGPPNFFSSRNFFQNLTSIRFGEKFPE